LLERDTHFYPDAQSIQAVEDYLLEELYKKSDGEPIRILSFACSSGQEPYSVGIEVDKFLQKHPEAEIEVLGVDYPSPALDRARAGLYTHFEVQRGLPIRDLLTYFDRVGEDWSVKARLRQNVEFQEFHLLSNLDELGQFDLVLFRNRLAQYSSPARIRVTRSLSAIVKPEGFLMFGSSEALPRANYGFEIVLNYPHVMRKLAEVIEPEPEPEIEAPPEPPRPVREPVEYVPDRQRA